MADILYCLVTRSIYRGKLQYLLASREGQVAQDGVDASGGVGHEDNGVERCVEELGYGGSRSIEVLSVEKAEVMVWTGFRRVSKGLEGSFDTARVGACGAYGWCEIEDRLVADLWSDHARLCHVFGASLTMIEVRPLFIEEEVLS